MIIGERLGWIVGEEIAIAIGIAIAIEKLSPGDTRDESRRGGEILFSPKNRRRAAWIAFDSDTDTDSDYDRNGSGWVNLLRFDLAHGARSLPMNTQVGFH